MSQTVPRRLHPQRLQNAFMQVGEPEAEYRPYPLHLIGRVLLGLLIALAGVGLCVLGFLDLDDIVECLLFGIFLIVVGLGIAWKMWNIWGQRFMLCPGGLVCKHGLKVKICRWEQVRHIQETEGKQVYEIFIGNAASWVVDHDHTQEIADLATRLRELATKHSIRWEMKVAKKAED